MSRKRWQKKQQHEMVVNDVLVLCPHIEVDEHQHEITFKVRRNMFVSAQRME